MQGRAQPAALPGRGAGGSPEAGVAGRQRGCYTRGMKSVASVPRALDAEIVREMTPSERLDLAFRLGEEDIESFRATNGLDRRTAIRLLERRRQATRRPSVCIERIIG